MVIELTESNFKKETSKGFVVIDFWAEWCGPCKMMDSVFEYLSKEIKGAKFAKVNVDSHADIAAQFSVQSIPALIILKEGKEIERIIGMQPKPILKSKIESILK